MPGGLGVREWLILALFAPTVGAGPAGLAALVLRLSWIAAEAVAAGVLYPLPMIIPNLNPSGEAVSP
jgi:uncharacterized membrane protein YbhN (UPF0104 family)